MASRASLRASDADREQIAERLRQATVEGRLAAHELEQRIARALRAQTYGELDQVVADLPGKRVAPARPRSALRSLPLPAAALAVVAVIAVAVLAVAVIASVFALWIAWIVFGWLILGHRGRAYRRWACASRRGRLTRANRGAVGGFTPWL